VADIELDLDYDGVLVEDHDWHQRLIATKSGDMWVYSRNLLTDRTDFRTVRLLIRPRRPSSKCFGGLPKTN